jgi:hypothetical protein
VRNHNATDRGQNRAAAESRPRQRAGHRANRSCGAGAHKAA